MNKPNIIAINKNRESASGPHAPKVPDIKPPTQEPGIKKPEAPAIPPNIPKEPEIPANPGPDKPEISPEKPKEPDIPTPAPPEPYE